MYIEDIIQLLESDRTYNFLAMAITPYHAVGVNAAIKYLINDGIEPNGFILMAAHPDSGRSVDLENFQIGNTKIKTLEFEYRFRTKKSSFESVLVKCNQLIECANGKDSDPKFYFVWTEIANNLLYAIKKSCPNKRLEFIKIDDGAASYIQPFQCRLSYLLYDTRSRNAIYKAKAYLKAVMYSLHTKVCEYILVKKNCLRNANVFVKDNSNKKLAKNEIFSKYYVISLRKKDHCLQYEEFSNSVIINSQGLGEFNVTDGVVDFEAFRKVGEILSSMNEKVILKPHPREKEVDKYKQLGWSIFEKAHVTQEEILANIEKKPKCIISIYSSTLLNAYGLFDIPVISLAKILLQEEISKTFKTELERYYSMYNSIVLFPNSYDELKTIIKKL